MFSDKELQKLLWPLVIEQILLMLVGMADTAMMSQAGEAAISGVALVDMFAYLIITLLTAASAGGAVIVSQYLGAEEKRQANSLRAAGDARYTMYAGVASMLLFRLGSAYLLAIWLNLGIVGVWLAMGLDWLARSVAYLLRYKSNRWQSCKAI